MDDTELMVSKTDFDKATVTVPSEVLGLGIWMELA